MKPELIDSIYEAAVLGELWPAVLEDIRRETNSVIGLLIARDAAANVTSITNPGMEHIPAEYQSLDLFSRSLRMPKMLSMQCADFVADTDFMTPEERERDPGYTEFLFPRGWGHGTATVITFPDQSAYFVNFERTLKAGRYLPEELQRLDMLRPHFGRALSLMQKTELRRAKDRVDALNALGIAAAALDSAGRVLAVNGAMEAYVPSVIADRRARLAFADRQVDRLWEDILLAGPRASVSLPIRREPFPVVAHLLPVRRQARDVFSLASRILVLMPVSTEGTALAADVIQVLFDLTPAEARIAYAIADGATITDISIRQSLSKETVRSHVKNIMRKTVTSRQVDLVTLLSSGALPGSGQSSQGYRV